MKTPREEIYERELAEARERIRFLENEIGVTFPCPRSFRLTPNETKLLGILQRREIMTQAAGMAGLYDGRTSREAAEPKIIDVLSIG